MAGVYIHIPFCKSKCPYCDFYSYRCDEASKSIYINSLIEEITTLSRCKKYIPESFTADTLYIGGGTPSVLTGEDLYKIITTAKKKFKIPPHGEITVECNPGSPIEDLAPYFKKAGVNRVSLGMQSAVDKERKILGRAASKERIAQVIGILRENGIDNISLDVMLGIPFQTEESLKETLEFAIKCRVQHISAYILKIEDGTHFDTYREKYSFPDEDAVCRLYNLCADILEKAGFIHYEISNFALPGFHSRHNTKYWVLEDYLGLGPSAHSYVNGKRFYFGSNTENFIQGEEPVFDCTGGDFEEYVMLRLRLKEGIDLKMLRSLYGAEYCESIIKKAPLLKEKGLVNFDGEQLSLTREGYLLSNAVICELI